jgi:peptide/nickel transport system substrate-binding protein
MVVAATPKRQMRSGRIILTCVITAVTLLAAACGSTANPAATSATGGPQKPVDGGSLVIATPIQPTGWNPHISEWDQSASLTASAVLEPLAKVGSDNGAKPWLATSWIANSAFDQWVINLRPGVHFQDGEPFDAAAVKANLEDAANGALSGEALRGIIKSVSVVHPLAVLVKLQQPWAAFPGSFLDAQPTMMMAPASLRSADHGMTHPIGTGPFTFVSWQAGNDFQTKKNPDYWQKGLPHLDALTFRAISDPNTEAQALQAGDVDMILTSSSSDAAKLHDTFSEVRDWETEPVNLILNTVPSIQGKPNPFTDVHARRALAYATDRTIVSASIGAGVESPTSPFSPTSPWGQPESQNGYPSFDLEKAKQEVAAYEGDTGQGSLSFTLSGLSDVNTTRLLQLLQAQWERAGIHATIAASPEASFITGLVGGTFNAALTALYSAPDPDQDRYFWSADNIKGVGGVNINMAQYSTPQMETDLRTGRQSGFPGIRKAAYDDLVRQINAASTNIWLYWTPWSLIANKRIHGLQAASEAPFGNYQPKTWLAQLWSN